MLDGWIISGWYGASWMRPAPSSALMSLSDSSTRTDYSEPARWITGRGRSCAGSRRHAIMRIMSPKGRVIIVGSVNEDVILTVASLPARGETIAATHVARRFGGKGANQAVAAARFGGRTTLVACVGDDPAGEHAIENLSANMVDTAHIARSSSSTGTAFVLVDADGENEIVIASGANLDLTAEHVQAALEGLGVNRADVVGIGFEVCDEVVRAAIAHVGERGAELVVNPSPVRPLPEPLADCDSTVILNAAEAACLASTDDPRSAAAEIASRLGARVVLTLGAQGALLIDGDVVTEISSLQVTARDTVGAGDTLLGAYCAARAAEVELAQSVRLAVAAAALSVTSSGAQEAMPTLSEVQAAMGR